jgi:HK97 family phage portal protein
MRNRFLRALIGSGDVEASQAFSPATLTESSRGGWTTAGSLPMAPSMGVQRWATYRAVYLTNPWVYASVQKIALGLSRLPIHVLAVDSDGNLTRARGDVPGGTGRTSGGQRLDRLMSSGYGGKSRNAMIQSTYVDRLTYGNALWRIIRDDFGAPQWFQQVPWRCMLQVVPGSDGMPVAYVYRKWNGSGFVGGPPERVDARDVIHFGQGSDPESIYGISPLESCRHTLALHDALHRHLVAFFSNSARPSGFVSIDKDLNKNRADEIRDLVRDLYSSPENAGKVLAAAGATWQQMGAAPEQTGIVELVKLSREEIAATFAIPPPVLGILDQAIKSNVKELREQFGRDSLGPWASDFEGEIAAQLLPQQPSWSNLTVQFYLAEMLRPDLESLALVIQRVAPQMTVDEIRTMYLGLEALKIPGLSDQPWPARGAQPMGSFDTEPKPADLPPAPPDPPSDAPAAQRESVNLNVTVQPPDVQVTVEPAHVTVEPAQVTVNPHAHITMPEPKRRTTRKVTEITRDANGKALSAETTEMEE